MSDPKEPTPPQGFLRKVAKFVANPTTEWRDLNSRLSESPRESTYDKAELKAMIERKQRNDFVRKREFDMLRRIRREGLSNDGLNSLGLSNIDDSEIVRPSRIDQEVKAKIDAIEKQMVGESFGSHRTSLLPSQSPNHVSSASHAAAQQQQNKPSAPPPFLSSSSSSSAPATALPQKPPTFNGTTAPGDHQEGLSLSSTPLPPLPPFASSRHNNAPLSPAQPTATPTTAVRASPAGLMRTPQLQGASDFSNPFDVEVNEIAHDPDLDEAVISFANADFEQCEQSLTNLISAQGPRHSHAETWLVLFDFYRAIGEHAKFENLAIQYAHQFGWSAPQWFSLPKLVAEASAQYSTPAPTRQTPNSAIGWVCPAMIDLEAIKKLRTTTLQLPMPWVFDWSNVQSVEPEACNLLSSLLRTWSKDPIEMHWIGCERLLTVLNDHSPVSQRDVDPSIWLLKLEILRLINRPDQFDVTAIDYCVTYEVSPPSWETSRCTVRLNADALGTTLSVVNDVSTGFVESGAQEDTSMGQISTVELSGQLVNDISATLKGLDARMGMASMINVTCAKLIRVDFIAAGDLLNWVLSRRQENRSVQFEDAHRLVALFFGAMGINEHAKVKVRNI